MPQFVLDILSTGCIILGVFFMLTGSLGILRLPDFFTRLHPAGIIDAMGMPLILIGLMIASGWNLTTVKIGLLLLFMLFSSPTACHALAKAASLRGRHSMARVSDESEEKEQAHDAG